MHTISCAFSGRADKAKSRFRGNQHAREREKRARGLYGAAAVFVRGRVRVFINFMYALHTRRISVCDRMSRRVTDDGAFDRFMAQWNSTNLAIFSPQRFHTHHNVVVVVVVVVDRWAKSPSENATPRVRPPTLHTRHNDLLLHTYTSVHRLPGIAVYEKKKKNRHSRSTVHARTRRNQKPTRTYTMRDESGTNFRTTDGFLFIRRYWHSTNFLFAKQRERIYQKGPQPFPNRHRLHVHVSTFVVSRARKFSNFLSKTYL